MALFSTWRFFSCLLIFSPSDPLVFFFGFHLSSLISSIRLCHFCLCFSLSRISSLVSPSTHLHLEFWVFCLYFSLDLISYLVFVIRISICFPPFLWSLFYHSRFLMILIKIFDLALYPSNRSSQRDWPYSIPQSTLKTLYVVFAQSTPALTLGYSHRHLYGTRSSTEHGYFDQPPSANLFLSIFSGSSSCIPILYILDLHFCTPDFRYLSLKHLFFPHRHLMA